MFLSFIIPVYNVASYLKECVESCCAQDIPSSEYEVICINDGSTDNSREILQDLSMNYQNLVFIEQPNGGVSKARNAGLEVARGDYVWFVDADDVIRENCLAQLREMVSSKEFDRLTFRYYRFTNESILERKAWLQDPNHRTGGGFDNMACPNIFSREFLLREKASFETGIPYGEDTLFVFRLQLAKPRELNLNEPFYYWRQHSTSATQQQTDQSRLVRIRSLIHVAGLVRQEYDKFLQKDIEMRSFIADKALMLELKALEQLAQLKQPAFSSILRELRNQGDYPIRKLPEAKYTVWECAKERSGLGTLRNILQYYSIHPWGLYLSALPYWAQRTKVSLSRKMRKNPVMNRLLDLKNRIIRR